MSSSFDLNLQTTFQDLDQYIAAHPAWGLKAKVIRTEKAGEGNMNVVLRTFMADGTSIILKQAKPFVYKYPGIPAPLNRIEVEHTFYKTILLNNYLRKQMPACTGYDFENHLMILEDLGSGSDFTYLYQLGNSTKFPGKKGIAFLSRLHQLVVPESYPDNIQLRRLNAEHIFEYPYRYNEGFDLDQIQPGLQELAQPFYESTALRSHVQTLKKSYLSTGQQLIHGDFYPGSWLDSKDGFKVIDPEFSFIGHAEYDLGIMIGHCKMSRVTEEMIKEFISDYDYSEAFDKEYMWQIAGIEIIRRLIGLAQLPVDLTLEEKKVLLGWALRKMMF
jgi:5-methylthioribose kinase